MALGLLPYLAGVVVERVQLCVARLAVHLGPGAGRV